MLLQGFLSALPTNRSQTAPWFSNDNFALSEAFEAVAVAGRSDRISRATDLRFARRGPGIMHRRRWRRSARRLADQTDL